ncbi:MAG: hypothetical protein RLZZ524_925 [Pseudomonadota bacterium]|jgi:hypothetical protein
MSVRDQIIAGVRSVVTELAESLEYRARSSNAGTPTYGSWTALSGLITGERVEVQEDAEQGIRKVTVARLRVTDAATDLVPGDQVRRSAAEIWAVVGTESGSLGSQAYTIERMRVLRAEPGRKGGA